jgi:hypothetical protein
MPLHARGAAQADGWSHPKSIRQRIECFDISIGKKPIATRDRHMGQSFLIDTHGPACLLYRNISRAFSRSDHVAPTFRATAYISGNSPDPSRAAKREQIFQNAASICSWLRWSAIATLAVISGQSPLLKD